MCKHIYIHTCMCVWICMIVCICIYICIGGPFHLPLSIHGGCLPNRRAPQIRNPETVMVCYDVVCYDADHRGNSRVFLVSPPFFIVKPPQKKDLSIDKHRQTTMLS